MTVMSSYFLAVDVGTSRTAAATARFASDGSLVAAPFSLGRSSDSAPSAIFAADGELLFGEAAERRGLAQPDRLVREFKRRIGDDVPIVAGDQRFAPEELYARMVAWVVDAVAEREGGMPAGISVAVPVTWGGHRSGLVSAALARDISAEVQLISEPEAAARHYESTSPLQSGHALAVYDLGGGTFDAVILRKDDGGRVRIVGEPLGISDFGGADFDDMVLRHAIAAAGLSAAALAADPAARVGLSTLRRESVEAKEALSFDSEAVVPLLVGQVNATVRLTRSEFEEMIEDGIERTIDVLAAALETAGVPSSELEAILLTGGSSRIPRIAELLSERFDRPIAIDADPKAIVALGAARAIADPGATASAVVVLAPAAAFGAVDVSREGAAVAGLEALDGSGIATAAARRRWFERVPAAAAMASGALVLASGIVLVSATGLGSSPVSNADGPSKSLSDWLGVTLFDASAASADQPAAAAPAAPTPPAPPESIQRADYEEPKATAKSTAKASNPRAESMQNATQAAAAPQAPASSAGGQTGGTTTPPASSTDPAAGPGTATNPTPGPTSDPAPDPTTDPTPDPTPEETTPPPAPEETTPPPAPEETTPPPAPEETTPPPAPEETTPPPAPEETTPPAPDPSPSPTDPV
jgi:cell division ATPase FtsA